MAELRSEHAAPLAQALGPAFYADEEAIRTAIKQHESFNVIHLETMFKVAVFVAGGRAFDRQQISRRGAQVVATDPERTAFFASAEDTVLAKLDWYRRGGGQSERQWRDVLGVLRAQRSAVGVDHSYDQIEALRVERSAGQPQADRSYDAIEELRTKRNGK